MAIIYAVDNVDIINVCCAQGAESEETMIIIRYETSREIASIRCTVKDLYFLITSGAIDYLPNYVVSV